MLCLLHIPSSPCELPLLILHLLKTWLALKSAPLGQVSIASLALKLPAFLPPLSIFPALLQFLELLPPSASVASDELVSASPFLSRELSSFLRTLRTNRLLFLRFAPILQRMLAFQHVFSLFQGWYERHEASLAKLDFFEKTRLRRRAFFPLFPVTPFLVCPLLVGVSRQANGLYLLSALP